MKKIKLTQQELDKAFPIQLLSNIKTESVFQIEIFKLKAMTKGVTVDDIELIQKILKNEN